MHDAEGDARGDARIDGVAARLQDREARLRGEVVPGDDPVLVAANHRPHGVDRLGIEQRVFASAFAHGYSWLARSTRQAASVRAPAARSAGVAFSASLWLTPFSQGTKIMPVGQR